MDRTVRRRLRQKVIPFERNEVYVKSLGKIFSAAWTVPFIILVATLIKKIASKIYLLKLF